jgi:hypothetical protein
MRINDKQKIILTAVVFTGIAIGLGVLNYLKFSERSELLAQIDRYVQEEQAATAKIKQIPTLREKRSKLIKNIDQHAEILPKEEHVQHDTFVEIIDGYRQDTKIIIQKAEYVEISDVENGPETASFIRHRYKFKVLGTVPDFIDFVNKIENHTRFLKVDAIKIKPLGTADQRGADLGDQADDSELAAAMEPVKEIELVISTYTYSRGHDKKI